MSGSIALRCTALSGGRGKLEHMFAGIERRKNAVPDAGWPSIDTYTCAASGLDLTCMSFAKDEAYRTHIHMAHGVDLSKGTCDVDLHYCMTTAADAVVKMKLSVWLLDMAGTTDLSALSTPDGTYTWTLEPLTDDYVPEHALVHNAIDLSAVASRKDVHAHLGIRIERLGAGDGDTHGGELFLLRGEIFLPMGTGESIIGL